MCYFLCCWLLCYLTHVVIKNTNYDGTNNSFIQVTAPAIVHHVSILNLYYQCVLLKYILSNSNFSFYMTLIKYYNYKIDSGQPCSFYRNTKWFQDTKGIIRNCKSKKNRTYNDQKKRYTNRDKQRSTKHYSEN